MIPPIVIITGTPGSGKTTIAKKLSLLLNYTYFDAHKYAKKAKLFEKYDEKTGSYVINPSLLAKSILKVRERARKGIVVDSHMSHYLPADKVKACIVATCPLKTLNQRLTKRGYNLSKIKDNLESEAFESSLTEAQDFGHKIFVIDTSKSYQNKLKNIAKNIKKTA